mmetsp:Transcript_26911/g.54101  ORF Transcript_26911/g.54101 Transcript_26911/m.54101 type:complete len:94 (-) Transcript_26911:91-372(-)
MLAGGRGGGAARHLGDSAQVGVPHARKRKVPLKLPSEREKEDHDGSENNTEAEKEEEEKGGGDDDERRGEVASSTETATLGVSTCKRWQHPQK